ncbi:MAG: hypothetical protein J7530_12460 [Novosphingobium sp.]|nr:hypothetical protein [Novosphingobium sp.]
MLHIPSSQFRTVAPARPAAPASKPSTFAAWRDLWRTAPREVRHDFLILTAATPVLLAAFAALWIMVPA